MNHRNLFIAVAAALAAGTAFAGPTTGTSNVVVTNTAVNPVKTEIVASTIVATQAAPIAASKLYDVTFLGAYANTNAGQTSKLFTKSVPVTMIVDRVAMNTTPNWFPKGGMCIAKLVVQASGARTIYRLAIPGGNEAVNYSQDLTPFVIPAGASVELSVTYSLPEGGAGGCGFDTALYGRSL